jgi:hypothetical protein
MRIEHIGLILFIRFPPGKSGKQVGFSRFVIILTEFISGSTVKNSRLIRNSYRFAKGKTIRKTYEIS